MRELRRNLGETNLSIRLFTLKDKKSLFRASYPDVHIIELNAKSEKHNVQLFTREFESYAKAKQYYEMYLGAFGHRLQAVGRKQNP
jgi:hypothetical protein